METLIEQSENYKRVERAIEFLERNFQHQPSLDEIATSVHLSKFHFQRLFKRWAGVTPSQFLHYLTIEYAKERLRQSKSVFETAFEAGLSSPSRLHDMFVTFEAVTPGEYKKFGQDLEIHYAFLPSPFGECLLATTDRGICGLRFPSSRARVEEVESLQKEWPLASFIESSRIIEPLALRLFSPLREAKEKALHLLLKGTNFQVQVWQALLAIPPGAMVSYSDVAAYIARPSAVRAVAHAIARNPISYIIPCHRVITQVGKAHRYRWGTARKKAILGWEASRTQAAESIA